jgi:hypothetical protein
MYSMRIMNEQKLLTGIAEADEGVRVSTDQWAFFGPFDPFKDMVHVVEARYCRNGPFELREDKQLPAL